MSLRQMWGFAQVAPFLYFWTCPNCRATIAYDPLESLEWSYPHLRSECKEGA